MRCHNTEKEGNRWQEICVTNEEMEAFEVAIGNLSYVTTC